CLPGRLWCATVNRYPIGFAGVDLVFDRDGLFSTMDPSADKRLFLADAYQRLIIRDPVGVLYCQVVNGLGDVCFADTVGPNQNIGAGLEFKLGLFIRTIIRQ